MTTPSSDSQAPLTGGMLWLAAIVLAAANFVAVLDMTIANVSVPNISGNLGVSTSQGTWVITSYAVAEAILVPLTGWLASHFGTVRVFAVAMGCFGLFSALCGLALSLGMLVAARICQGLAGGPLMPLSQTLLLRIFPKEKAEAAIGLWSMTTIVAPVLGPILGGYLCDEYSWPWIFYINLPIAVGCAWAAWKMLARYESPIARNPIDKVGLALLVLWVGSLQIMLDEGKQLDWFASSTIAGLAVVAAIGFAAFLIWELHAEHPAVNLRVFRHRGFSASVLTISLAFGAFFGANVLTPQWLQSFMGYTALEAGKTTAWSGFFALFAAPIAAGLGGKVDARKLVFGGVIWLGIITLWRTVATTDMTYWQVAVPLMAMGLGIPFFFVPTTGLAMASVDEEEMASAAGLMNFLRTLSGAFATSLITTLWDDRATLHHAELVGVSDGDGSVRTMLEGAGSTLDAINQSIDQLLTSQSVMLATNDIMAWVGVAFVLAASAIWLAPKPRRTVAPGTGGH
ncbi:DHA2 family efflux MFS transporter permease subunit [Ralstonia pseudosolanacearum]|uniref:DHA2 family efflux MFS transporter permease subunit n=1 Tax=Ralstonia pseudosolanacearum TaxID=1310165 RepID=UPI0018A55CB6|nr:DHA2 family efflux MFS transporter permease subunit [Ralstonia pseudosolanacearum]BCL94589.1 MFS transporter [Ralstonia solanacearum]BCN07155.1 MFS transporter [Ralstonia solanacearum]